MSFDLANYQTADGETFVGLDLELPNGEIMRGTDGAPVTLHIVSVDDPRYTKVQRRVLDERIAKVQRKRNKAAMTAEEMAREGTRLTAAGIVGWSNNVVMGGQPFEYSPENAEKLCGDFPFIREQVDDAINDRARFFKT